PWCLPVTKPRPDASNPETANLHCYRSIATMTCYRHKNLHDTASRYTASEIRQQNAEIAESFMAETE
ncbi:MAG: hypothetical protein VW644_07075, partial [Alphaproteobacteria bacterium]